MALDPIAITALIVSFVALFTTCIQVAQAFFATAEGYRRCQPSVMGPWAKMTHKRWRWKEFRYETLYTTPEFFLVPWSNVIQREGQFKITGDEYSRKIEIIHDGKDHPRKTTMVPRIENARSHELVCWIPFLQALRDQSGITLEGLGDISERQPLILPALRHHQRSWDFMPPDVVRPLASCNITDICILARRLGMLWTDFRPQEGSVRAEGSGHVITSTMVRGIGLVVQYGYLDYLTKKIVEPRTKLPRDDTYIWKREADMMGFGILPGNPDFSLPDLQIGTKNDILARLDEIDPSKNASGHIGPNMEVNAGWTISFRDLIPLVAPMLRIRGSSTIRIPPPTQYVGGLTAEYWGFKAFHFQLQAMVGQIETCDHPQRIKVLRQYEELKERYGEVWENHEEVESRAGHRSITFLDHVHTKYDDTTAYFQRLERQTNDGIPSRRFHYFDLVKAHITHAVHWWPEAKIKIDAGQGRPHFHWPTSDWRVEGMHVNFDYLPKYVQTMRAAGFDDEEVVKDAWVTLIFRAFCWQRCHFMIDNVPLVPSMYYGSRQPLYIG